MYDVCANHGPSCSSSHAEEVVGQELRDGVLRGAGVLGLQHRRRSVTSYPSARSHSQPRLVPLVEAEQLLEAGQHALPVLQARVVRVVDAAQVGGLVGVAEHHRVVAGAHARARATLSKR